MVRAQFTIEFMLLFTLIFFVFLVLLTIFTQLADSSIEQAEMQRLDTVAESIQKIIVLAHESGTGYESTIDIKSDIDGVPLNITLDTGADMLFVRNTVTNHTVTRILPNVTGNIHFGCNRIIKEGGVVNLDTC